MRTIVLLLCSQLALVSSYSFEQPVAKTVWHERCEKNAVALNDCNWCRCGANHQFMCQARSCREVDVFGHFNDAIKDIDVGMEGHGVWRSTSSACEPGVHYHRGKLICVCDEDGAWPNPVCRDIFRILHAVEVPKTNVEECAPTKLYLIGCNVCFCPSTGRIDSSMCTKRVCDENDPVLEPSAEVDPVDTHEDSKDLYAECETDLVYKLGCRTCTCLRNNRLVCGNCTGSAVNKSQNYCDNQPPLTVFDVECNRCYCDRNSHMVCSAKRCLGKAEPSLRRFMDIDERYIEQVETPLDDRNCRVGSKYKRGCNTCLCLENEAGIKMFACTTEPCGRSLFAKITRDCVMHSSYELNCLKCQCVSANGRTWQWCETESRCPVTEVAAVDRRDLDSLHGYCEPLHEYVKGCNKCQCLSEGQMLVCTDVICEKSPDPIVIDVVPLKQHGSCPKGHTYKIDCNICVCLKNGNALCTTMDCAKQTSNVSL